MSSIQSWLKIALVVGWATTAASLPSKRQVDDLLVETNLFTVQGVVANASETVRFFGGIPYAEPPVGDLRFRPPVTKRATEEIIDASYFGPSCMQYNNGQPTVYSEYLKGFLLTPGQEQSEDCLTLNIWAPRGASSSAPEKTVMIWVHGGGYTGGGSASPYKYGDRLVRDNQDVIMVALNYRVNIFGFPGAAALTGVDLNPGILDVRMAVEWTYHNIHAFGGNASNMILFGQSAGAGMIDKYSYAFADDPLVTGFIAQSSMGDGVSAAALDRSGSNFTYVADQLNCTGTQSEIFSCMQSLDATDIIQAYNRYNASANGDRTLSFQPKADNRTSFSNYTDLQVNGRFAQLPILIAQTNNEAVTLVPFDPEDADGPSTASVHTFSCGLADIPGERGAAARNAWNVPVYRSRYFGEWPNVNPLPWLGAYHSSDMPMTFGTSDLLGPDTESEKETSRYMQGAWVAFAKDPAQGLSSYGWPTYNATSGEGLVKLGFNGSTSAVVDNGLQFLEACEAD